jgi:hypothetical protein
MITAKEALELSMENKNYKEDLKHYRQLVDESIREAAKDGLRMFNYFITGNYHSTIGIIIENELKDKGFEVCSDENLIEYSLYIKW